MPSLESELKKIQTPEDELWLLGCEAWRKNTQTAAVAELLARVQDQPKLLRVLVQHYFDTCIVPNMSGATLKESMQGGHAWSADGQKKPAIPHGPVESGEANPNLPSGQDARASPLSPSEDASAIKSVPLGYSKSAEASSPVRGGTGHSPVVQNQMASARPSPKPNPPRGLSAMIAASQAQARSLFDTFKVRGEIPIGDLTVLEARKIAGTNEREARILRRLCDHVGGYVPPGAMLRDIVKVDILEEAVAQNMEASDAA